MNFQFPADLVTFTEEILHGKLQFLCRVGLKINGPISNVFYNLLTCFFIIGLCDKISLRVNLKGGNGGRKLTYAYSVSYSAQNSGAASGQVSTVLTSLNSTLQSVSQNAKRYKVDKNDTFIGVYLKFTVIATNFLSQSSSSSLTLLRENKNLPTVLIGALAVETTVDRAVTLKGK